MEESNIFIIIGISILITAYLVLCIYHGHQELMNLSYREMEEASRILW